MPSRVQRANPNPWRERLPQWLYVGSSTLRSRGSLGEGEEPFSACTCTCSCLLLPSLPSYLPPSLSLPFTLSLSLSLSSSFSLSHLSLLPYLPPPLPPPLPPSLPPPPPSNEMELSPEQADSVPILDVARRIAEGLHPRMVYPDSNYLEATKAELRKLLKQR